MTTTYYFLAGGAIFVLVGIWTMQRSPHPFDLRDAFMDGNTGKASLNALIIGLMALLSCWVVVVRAQKDDVVTLLLGILSVFVVSKLAGGAIGTFKPPAPGSVTEESSQTKTTTTTP